MSLLQTLKQIVTATSAVIQLDGKVDRLARGIVESDQDKDRRIRQLEDRLLKVETVLEVAMKTGMIKLPPP